MVIWHHTSCASRTCLSLIHRHRNSGLVWSHLCKTSLRGLLDNFGGVCFSWLCCIYKFFILFVIQQSHTKVKYWQGLVQKYYLNKYTDYYIKIRHKLTNVKKLIRVNVARLLTCPVKQHILSACLHQTTGFRKHW